MTAFSPDSAGVPADDPVLELDRVSLEYRLYTQRGNSIRDWLVARVQGRRHQTYRSLWAVKDLTLACRKGERLGIMGPNGAGKTSLLRLIAGIYPPAEGRLIRRGRVVPLLELGLGFNGEMTGAENVVLAGVLLGKTRAAARAAIPRVIAFAQLEDFADVPVKYYSSGMTARLAFSIAMETEPDILLLDEVFAVGDIHWIRQAEERIRTLLDRASVVIMVSHNPQFLQRLCTRGLYIEHGEVQAEGPIAEVTAAYEARRGGKEARIVDSRATSPVRIHYTLRGADLQVRVEGVPLLGESWVGIFAPGADRNSYLGYRRVTADVPHVDFRVGLDQPCELRVYRWTPGGESLEASQTVESPTPAA
jgi:ABC-type polysaccharide/polyol phosphate transport system ATPase subunit